jgi:uncharacterized protein (TIGR02271 family)
MDDGPLRVPELEERLTVEKRVRAIGEARFRRRVAEEERTVGVDVARERVRVARRSVTPRPASAAELERAFTAQSLRIPLLGEAPQVRKAPFVTGEVVVHRRRVAEAREVSDRVRRQRVEVEMPPTSAAPPPAPARPPVPAIPVPAIPVRRVLDDVRAGWSRARAAAHDGNAGDQAA